MTKYYIIQLCNEENAPIGVVCSGNGSIALSKGIDSATHFDYNGAVLCAEKLLQNNTKKYSKISSVNICEVVLSITDPAISYNREDIKERILDKQRFEIQKKIMVLQEQLKNIN